MKAEKYFLPEKINMYADKVSPLRTRFLTFPIPKGFCDKNSKRKRTPNKNKNEMLSENRNFFVFWTTEKENLGGGINEFHSLNLPILNLLIFYK